MSGKKWGMGIVPLMWMAMSLPAAAIDLSNLCRAASDCVVAANTTIDSASAPLTVGGNFTVNPGVVLVFRVPVRIQVLGNMVLSGTLGAPGDGGSGGAGGGAGQAGGAGATAPAVASGIFDVRGTITIESTAAAAVEGGTGGSGGLGDSGQPGGAGGAGGAAGSLTFNTCSAFTSAAGAQVLASGGAGGIGQTGALGGAGGAAGTVAINAKRTIDTNAAITALGGAGGAGGTGAGANGASGRIVLKAGQGITVGNNTLNAGTNTPSIEPNQPSIAALADLCDAPAITQVSPSSGTDLGGTLITITGTGFTGATAVTVGGVACTGVTVVNSNTITCTTARGSAGVASVLVTTANGTSAANALFNYIASSYAITTAVNPPGAGTVSCTPNPVLPGGSSTCTATANAGYAFSGFSGDCTGATCTLSDVTSVKSVTATFTDMTPKSIPTLSEWAMLLMAALMSGLAVLRMRRR